jgi:hypothetical protein
MKKQELKELLTPEVLSTIHTAVECYNWEGDMIETMRFCNWCYWIAGQKCPEFDDSFEMENDD